MRYVAVMCSFTFGLGILLGFLVWYDVADDCLVRNDSGCVVTRAEANADMRADALNEAREEGYELGYDDGRSGKPYDP